MHMGIVPPHGNTFTTGDLHTSLRYFYMRLMTQISNKKIPDRNVRNLSFLQQVLVN